MASGAEPAVPQVVQSVPLGAVALALSLWALGGPAGSPTRCMADRGVAEEDASATVTTEFFTNGWPPELSPIRSLVPLAIRILRAQGLHEAPDVGLVPRQLLFDTVMNDDSFLTMDADVTNTLVDKMRDMARAHLDGWSDFRLRRVLAKVDSEVQAPRPRAASWTHSAVVPAGRFNSKAEPMQLPATSAALPCQSRTATIHRPRLHLRSLCKLRRNRR